MVSAIRPLRVEELAEIFAIDFNTAHDLVEEWRPEHPENEVLSACSTLIAIVNDGDFKIVQFSHFSVEEFLTSDRLRTSGVERICDYYIPLDGAHAILAQVCLTVLLQLDKNIDKKRLATFPLAFYAAQHWVDHAKFKDVTLWIQDAMETLFDPTKPYFKAWTWIHDIDSRLALQSIDDLAELPLPPSATPLYYAVLCGFAALAKHLITVHGENVNARCGRHGAPLRVASYMGHVDAAGVLLDHGADANANVFGNILLGSAYSDGYLNVMHLLLENGADPDIEHGFSGHFLSHTAASLGKTEVVHLLLSHNADVNSKDKKGRTPLHYASINKHVDVIQLLLQYDADINIADETNSTPLHLASGDGHAVVAKLLIEHNADINARDEMNWTPLHLASINGRVEVVKLLLEHWTNPDSRDYTSATSLHWASRNGHVEVVRLLLEHGSAIHSRDYGGETPLDCAAMSANVQVAKVLLEHGADTNWTQLHWATTYGHAEFVELLLELGVDVNARDGKGSISLHLASSGGYVGIIELLINHGAEVNARDDTNLTPLHCASLYGRVESIEILLKHGADVNARNKQQLTPLNYISRIL